MPAFFPALFLACLITAAPVSCPAGQDVVRVSTSYKSLFSTPEQTGMLDRIIREAFARIGMQTEIVFTPTERSLADVNAGLLDAEMNRIAGMEKMYPNLIRVPEPNMVMDFVAFARKDRPIAGWTDLEKLYVGIVSGWKILEENTRGFAHVTLVPTETELFTMLDKDRLDVALYSRLAGYEKLQILGCTDIRHLEPPLVSREMFLYLHKKHAHLVDDVAAALREMKKDGTYQRIVDESTAHLRPAMGKDRGR